MWPETRPESAAQGGEESRLAHLVGVVTPRQEARDLVPSLGYSNASGLSLRIRGTPLITNIRSLSLSVLASILGLAVSRVPGALVARQPLRTAVHATLPSAVHPRAGCRAGRA